MNDAHYLYGIRQIEHVTQRTRRDVAGWLEQMGKEHPASTYLKSALNDLRDAVENIQCAIEELEDQQGKAS